MTFIPTEEQTAILGHNPDRHARVLAGPGTGKSATLVALIDQLLAGNEAPRVKLLTFTRAATGLRRNRDNPPRTGIFQNRIPDQQSLWGPIVLNGSPARDQLATRVARGCLPTSVDPEANNVSAF